MGKIELTEAEIKEYRGAMKLLRELAKLVMPDQPIFPELLNVPPMDYSEHSREQLHSGCSHNYQVSSPIDTVEVCIRCGHRRRC